MKPTEHVRHLRVVVVILGSLCCLDGAPAAETQAGERPVLHVPLAGSGPAIDGRLDEPCWKDAAKTGPLKVTQGRPAGLATEAFILRDAEKLYVGVTCAGKKDTGSGKPPKQSEVVELLIDSNGDRNSYYVIGIARASGKRAFSSYNEHDPPWCDRTWQPSLESAAADAGDRWTAEIVLPFNLFNKNRTLAAEIGLNLRRSGMRGGETHCWQGNFSDPRDVGLLAGIPARQSLPEPEYGLSGLTRWYRPPNKAGRTYLAEQQGAIQLGPGSAHPGTTGEVKLELEGFLLEGDPHACGIIRDLAVDEEKGELYVLSDTRAVRGVAELRVFDRRGNYLRTVMPLNPNLPPSSVEDLCRKTAREGDAELVVPKLFLPWGESSFYGDWWHHPQKVALAPDGDLIMSNLFRGTLWRLKPDGRLAPDRWTSTYHRGRNEPFESTVWTQESWHVPDLKNYMPFHALHYPYFHFAPDGVLYVSAGQSSGPTRQYAYHFEVGEEDVTYHREIGPDEPRGTRVWKCRIHPGLRLEICGSFGGFAEPAGLALDGERLIVADAGNNRLQVVGENGQVLASITHYEHKGERHALDDPTALAMDREGHLYVLLGPKPRPADPRIERTLGAVRNHVDAAAAKPPGAPRRLVKLRSWRRPELLAASDPLHTDVLQIALDAGVSPPLVWVANGAGPGTLLQLAGDDLSVDARWADDGAGLSCPRQSGCQPLLNIDPQTGHLYVEDDSNYRLKQYGTVYRLDQQGNVLEKWAPHDFNARGLRGTSPWWTLDYERHFRSPAEPLSIDSLFGKDGRVYRWKLSKADVKILRFDRSGKPIPFAATGTNALFVDPAMQHNFWHDVYHGMDVDRQGNIYYVAKVDSTPKSRPVSAYEAWRRQVNVYDADGKLRQNALLVLECVRGLEVDAERNLYIVHRPAERPWENYLALSKFAPRGGDPLWSRPWEGWPGEAQLSNAPCHCTAFRPHQTLDGKGYLYAAAKYSVQVIDCETGKLVWQFGGYGNMDCRGKASKFPHPELPFGTISALSVWKDRLFAVDVLNRRIVKCRIHYGPAGYGDRRAEAPNIDR